MDQEGRQTVAHFVRMTGADYEDRKTAEEPVNEVGQMKAVKNVEDKRITDLVL